LTFKPKAQTRPHSIDSKITVGMITDGSTVDPWA